jgi:hypothetical protein
MGIVSNEAFIDGEKETCRGVVAEILRTIRSSPTGKKRHQHNSNRTLYTELKRLGFSWQEIADEVAWNIMNARRHISYIDRLKAERDEAQSAFNQIQVNDIDKFLANLVFHHGKIYEQLQEEGNEVIQEIMKRRLETVMYPVSRLIQLQHSARDRFNNEVGAGKDHTNVKKIPLNRVTVQLCNIITRISGKPQYGIVGQLLFRSGLEENGTYKQMTARMKRRFSVGKSK